jgi:ADP-ribosylglycohydrolase
MAIGGDYLERVYAGFIGKNVGIRLGAPVEPAIWTYERIREVYGEVTSYLKPYRNFAADDDANGPVYFIRPLIEGDPTAPLTAEAVGRAWLDYARDGKGMFWWGGYGVSTEHTAYLNLKAGIPAPESGSIARNGATVAEQIGGQIFIDTWGLVWPGRPKEAAAYAATAASVSHDGDGLNGARFIAACIAAAFEQPAGGMRAIVDAALAFVPPDSLYAAVARAVIAFHDAHPADWRACQEYLIAEWGYDRYPGLCHMIPNAGVCVLALLYGDGNFSRIVEIATMCGWDTDCNAGNVGTVAGVYYGLGSIPAKYRDPINDGIVLSGLPGSLNILDIPTFSRVLAAIGYRLAGEAVPEAIAAALKKGDGEQALHFDFALPGSTHCMRVSDPVGFAAVHRDGVIEGGRGALEFRYERLAREASGKLYYKSFYRRADFDDERYSPTFAPTARPGQTVRLHFRMESWEGEKIGVTGYVRDTWTGRDIPTTAPLFPVPGREYTLEFVIPEVGGSQVDEVGIILTGFSGAARRDSGRLLFDLFEINGKARYSIDIGKQAVEFGCVTPFSHDGGNWAIEGGRMRLMTNVAAASYTGGHSVADQRVSATVKPLAGSSHLLVARAAGAMRAYLAGFDGAGRVSILKRDFGLSPLASADFLWQPGRDYQLCFEASGDKLVLSIDGVAVLEANDATHRAGMVGCASVEAARALYGPFLVEELR